MNRAINFFTKLVERYLPNAYVIALILTILSFLMAMVFTDHKLADITLFWGNSFWNLLKFSMQMSLILILGNVLADTRLVRSLLKSLSSFAKGQVSATLTVTLVSLLFCYINWGLGLVVGAVFCVYVAKKLKRLNYGLLVASSYSGFLVWHGGLSGSIPLKLTNIDSNLAQELNVSGIAIGESLFSSFNLIILIATCLAVLVVNLFFSLRKNQNMIDFVDSEESRTLSSLSSHPLEKSKFLNLTVSFLCLSYLAYHFMGGGKFDLNTMIFAFLFLSIFLHGRAASFLASFDRNVKSASGIMLQFMFYSGIMGVILQSGLGDIISSFFISISTEKTFLVWTYLSAGLLNFFVPSGGGQWAIQGPIILPAAKSLGVDLSQAAMAIAWGDAWTNMVQPFWALPLLSITGIKLKEIMFYLFSIFLVVGGLTTIILYLY